MKYDRIILGDNMNRKEIIKYLKKYNLDPKKYIIISGAAMVLYGFKEETPDIDIAVTKEYKKELLSKYNCVLENPETDAYIIDDTLNFGNNFYKRRKEYVEGFPVMNIDDLIETKMKLNRAKDRKDLKLIFSHMK